MKKGDDNTLVVIRKATSAKVIYWLFQALTLATLITSIIMYFIRHVGLETTLNQIFMCAMTLLTMNIPHILERRFKIYIPNYITIVLYFMLFFHFVLGEVYRAYDHIILFDKILHTTSGVIIAFASFSVVSILNNMQKNKTKMSPFFVVLFTFCFAMTSEYLWEIVEYAVDTLMSSNMQRWQDGIIGDIPSATATGEFVINTARGSGLRDTMSDMMVNVLGALAVCIYAYIGMKVKPDWFATKTILTRSDIIAMKDDPRVKIDPSFFKAVGVNGEEYFMQTLRRKKKKKSKEQAEAGSLQADASETEQTGGETIFSESEETGESGDDF